MGYEYMTFLELRLTFLPVRKRVHDLAAALLVDETLWGTQGLLRVGRPITHHPLDLLIVHRDPLQSTR